MDLSFSFFFCIKQNASKKAALKAQLKAQPLAQALLVCKLFNDSSASLKVGSDCSPLALLAQPKTG
jgi:hypothetical protein